MTDTIHQVKKMYHDSVGTLADNNVKNGSTLCLNLSYPAAIATYMEERKLQKAKKIASVMEDKKIKKDKQVARRSMSRQTSSTCMRSRSRLG